MVGFNERIIAIAEHYGLSKPADFAKHTGFSHQVSSNYLKSLRKPSVEALEKIQLCFDSVNPEWLLTGKGEMLKDSKNNDEITRAVPSTVKSRNSIPLVSTEAIAGFGNIEFAIKEQDIQSLYDIPDFVNTDFMIRVKGSSMYPKYNSGDIVACRIIRESKFIQWNKVHVLATTEQGILIKRLKKSSTKGCFLAVSDNKEYEPFDIPENELNGIALVVGVVRLE